jgi:histone H3/H4
MSVELPFAPVDAVIRRNAGSLRVSADAAEELARRIQIRGAALAAEAAERATAENRKTLMAADFENETEGDRLDESSEGASPAGKDSLTLPVAPVDRIARLDIDDRYRVSMDARVVLATLLESYADEVAAGGAILARHAGRRTITAEDIETYFDLLE